MSHGTSRCATTRASALSGAHPRARRYTPGMASLRSTLLTALSLLAGAAAASTAPPEPPAVEAPAPAPAAPVALGPALEWRWPADADRVYAIEVALDLPEPLTLPDAQGGGLRLSRVELGLVTACSAIEESPPGWRVLCLIRDVALRGQAASGEQGRLGPALTAAASELKQGALDLNFRRDGHIGGLALAGLPTDRKSAPRHEVLRVLLQRAVVGLELVTPAAWKGGFSATGPGILTYVPREQSLGATRLIARATDESDPAQLRFDTEGRGVVRAASLGARERRSGQPYLSMALASSGALVFDAQTGALIERSWTVLGQPTGEQTSLGEYAQSGLLRLLLPGDLAPELGPSGELDPSAAPSDAALALAAARPALLERLGGERVVFEP